MADISVKLPKPKYGQIVVLQKNGDEPRGHGFPLISTTCVVGRCLKCDIRISSGDVSDTHCKFLIDEVSGEASLEIRGNETEVNGTHFEPVSLVKLHHKDVILIGGRKLRFEYLPPDYKPIPKQMVETLTDSFNAEVVDMEENGDVVDSNAEREEDIIPEVPSTPSLKRVSFGPYLSPEQFDNTLPPATPVKKGATPRRSTRYSGLKFTRAPVDPLIEEEPVLETTADEQVVTNEKECVDETMISEDAEASVSSVASTDETSVLDRTSPSLAEANEFPEISSRTNLDVSSIDAMSTMSDVSNIAVIPSECCSFLDEPIEDGDFEVVEQEDTSLFSDDLIAAEIPVPEMTTPQLTNGTDLLRSFTTSSLAENMGEEEEEGITLSPEDMSETKNVHSSTLALTTEQEGEREKEEAKKELVLVEFNTSPSSSQANYTDVREVKQLLQTPKPIPDSPKADYTNVEGVKQLLKTPKNSLTAPQSPQADYSDIEGVKDLLKTPKPVVPEVTDDLPKDVEPLDQVEIVSSVEKLIETPESSPSMKNPQIIDSPPADSTVPDDIAELPRVPAPHTPKADDTLLDGVERLLQTPDAGSSKLNCTDLEGVARLLETPKSTRSVTVAATAVVGTTPQADYTDVRGVKKLLQTPKPPPNMPKADYRDVRGVKRLLRTPTAAPDTPKADYTDVEGVDLLMKTPQEKVLFMESDEEEVPEKMVEESTPEAPIADSTEKVVSDVEDVVIPQVDEDQPLTSEKDTKEEIPREELEVKKDEGDVAEARGSRRTRAHKNATPKIPSKQTPSPSQPEDHKLVKGKESCHLDARAEVSTVDEPEESSKIQIETEQVEEEEPVAASAPKRGRRAAAAKANTPKADYRDVSGVKRLLRTPKAAPGTPKADYSDVEGVDLLMKTPKPKDLVPQIEEKEKVVVEEEIPEVDAALETHLEVSGTTEQPVRNKAIESVEEITAAVTQMDEIQSAEEKEEPTAIEKETTLPKRARRSAATAKTPKADYNDVSGVKRLLRTPKAAPGTPKADYSDVEGVDLLMKTPKPKDPVPQIEEEEKVAVEEDITEKLEVDAALETRLESSETTEQPVSKNVVESTEKITVAATQMDEIQSTVEKEETTPPKRGRRGAAAAAKTNTPKADYSNVRGVKRLLRTPKAAPGTPKADYSEVEGIELLMKTPKPKDPVHEVEEEEKDVAVVEEKVVVENAPEDRLESTETNEKLVSDVGDAAPQTDEVQPAAEEAASNEKESTPPKRVRRAAAAAANANTPKADYRDVRGVKRLLKTPTAAASTPKADYTNVEGVDLLMKTPQVRRVEPESEEVIAEEKSVEETAPEASPLETAETTAEPAEENPVASVAPEGQIKESEVEAAIVPTRRSQRSAPTPKTNTPKPAGRSKRKQPQSEPEIQSEVNSTVGTPTLPTNEKEMPAIVEAAPSEETSSKAEEVVDVPVKTVSTPKRGRRAAVAPASKIETLKAARSTGGKRQSESDCGQLEEEVESRPLRSKRRKDDLLNDAKLSLSPVVRLYQIDLSSCDAAKGENKRNSSSSHEEVAPIAAKPVRRGRQRKEVAVAPEPVEKAKVEKKTAARRGRAAAAPAVEEPIPSADEVEEVEAKPAKKTTRRPPSKQTVVAEKAEGAPEEKRRRGASKPAVGLDDVEMMHEGKGHAADIHANRMLDDKVEETNEELPATTSSGRSTRGKKATLKVHFETGEATASPVRSTRSTRKTTAAPASPPDQKLSVQLERDTGIDTLAAVAASNEEVEKVPAKRPRQKKVPAAAAVVAPATETDESPAVPPTKRTRGAKKVSTESDVPNVENSSPPHAAPSPRRTRRTRNI